MSRQNATYDTREAPQRVYEMVSIQGQVALRQREMRGIVYQRLIVTAYKQDSCDMQSFATLCESLLTWSQPKGLPTT
jgi:hypothetical protein